MYCIIIFKGYLIRLCM